MFVITGSPRSGTRYMSRLMTALGLRCDHEVSLRPLATAVDLARWPTLGVGESSWMAWCVLPLMVGRRIPVLHVIRNPWDVIDSLTNRNHILNPLVPNETQLQSVRELINAYLPDLFARERRVDRAAAMVVGWNRLIAEQVPSRFVYHLEQLDVPTVRKVLAFIGDEKDDATIEDALATVSTSTNSGYTVDTVPGVSDPDVARWVSQYAREQNCDLIKTMKIRDVAGRQSPEELIESMNPVLADEVNEYAAGHGYSTYELATAAA